MSFHISSEQPTSGYSYSGVWTFSGYLEGDFEVIEQYVDPSAIPWITRLANLVVLGIYTQEFEFSLLRIDNGDFETYSVSDDAYAISGYITDRFQAVCDASVNAGILVSCLYDNNAMTMTFTFTSPVGMRYSEMPLIASIFETPTTDVVATEFVWSTKNLTIHPHLYLKIPQINTKIEEPDIHDGSILMHTEGTPLVGMIVSIFRRTKTLNISLYRSSMPNTAFQMYSQWDLILRKL